MNLPFSSAFDPGGDLEALLASVPARPAVFALFPEDRAGAAGAPYLGRTRDLRRRLARLLSPPRASSRMLNLREVVRHIEYQPVGSSFEAQWWLYLLSKSYDPEHYRQRLRLRPPALLKLNLAQRFPRCYPTRRLARDGSLYYGPFPTRVAAERFAAEFLDFFKIRRCVEDLAPDPAHPGCIYSQMHMCLAPCFAGCTDHEYQAEVSQVVQFLDAQGRPLLRALEGERARASEALEFELAAKIHRRLEKIHEVLRQRPELVRNLRDLHGIVVQPAAEPRSVAFFRLAAGELRGPAALSLDENVPSPVPLDEQLHTLLGSLCPEAAPAAAPSPTVNAPAPQRHPAPLPPWEHLSLLARWYYSSFRQGEIVMLDAQQSIPHARLIRLCRKVLAPAV